MPLQKTSVTLDPRILTEIDRRTEKFSGEGNRSAVISRHLDRYFSMLARARRELRELLSDSETMLIVDVLNGVGFWDTFGVYLVAHEVADGIGLDRLDEKWQVDGKALIAKLSNLTDAQHLALVDSVTMWWDRVAKGEQPPHKAADVFRDAPRQELEAIE
jgi:hypothetical protein